MRQAPDGCKEGGSQPTDISVLNRRFYWLRLFRETQGKNDDADVKKLLPTLDSGSHINAAAQLRLEAAAKRRL
jgi:hypothetical protein